MDLNINVSQILRNNGYTAARCTKDVLLEAFLERVKPLPITTELTRIGGYGDGGYLIPDDLDGLDGCFSPGVSTIANFELELAQRGIRSFMADHSVSEPPTANPLFDFTQKYLGDSNNHMFMRLEDWVLDKAGDNSRDLLLQMDIEGAELPVLLDTPRSILRRFRTMVIEFHNLELLISGPMFSVIQQVFTKILKDFCVVHLHPNNYFKTISFKNVEIPPIIEFTFYRKDRAILAGTPLNFPHLLDSKNVFDKPDVVLPACWRKNPNEVDDFLRVVSGVIHVGANLGQERFLYDQLELAVVWIEPLDNIFETLSENIAPFPNQTALKYLITDQDHKRHNFYIADNQAASSSVFKPTGHFELWPEVQFPETREITGMTLATVLKKENISLTHYQALVIDTQGSELLVLQGLGELIRQFRYIRTEAADFDAYAGCCRLADLTAYLAKFGFVEKIRSNMTHRSSGGNYYDLLYVRTGDV